MAQKSTSLGYQSHARSISFPNSRANRDYFKFKIELNRLKTWESSYLSTAAAALSSGTIKTGLARLAELYNCVQGLLESPTTQQGLLKHRHERIVEEALEGSVQLLDFCCKTKDLLMAMKDHLQDLQSALRRKGGDSSIECHISAYMRYRKEVKRDVIKSLRALKKMGKNVESSAIFYEDQQLSALITLLREVVIATISVFRSLLVFLSTRDSKLKLSNGLLLFSKMVATRSTANKKLVNEVGSVDVILHALHEHTYYAHSSNSKIDVQMILRRLQSLDVNIQGLEDGLEGIFRLLIQNRVSLLNIITSQRVQ